MAEPYDIAIVGAGLVGSAMALWLAKNSRFRLALIERNPISTPPVAVNQRVVALGHVASNILRDIDVFEALDHTAAYPYRRMCVWDENSNGELEFDADDAGLPELGHMVDSELCTYRLQQKAFENNRIDSYFDCEISAFESAPNKAHLTTSHGALTARLVIAADGARSWLRQQAKIFANKKSYDQAGIVALVSTLESHQDCAWQRFLETGPLALLPVADKQCSIVWSAHNDTAQALMSLSDNEFSERLTQATQARLGAISLVSKRQIFPLVSARSERYFRERLVLLGDAAHSIHPLAGQGANLGFKDLKCLGELLVQGEASDLGDTAILAKYQRIRQKDNEQTDMMMTALNAAYQHNDSPLWMALRGIGMNWINRSDTVRSLLAKQAMGLD